MNSERSSPSLIRLKKSKLRVEAAGFGEFALAGA